VNTFLVLLFDCLGVPFDSLCFKLRPLISKLNKIGFLILYLKQKQDTLSGRVYTERSWHPEGVRKASEAGTRKAIEAGER
jgi:hypothetical protein